MFRSLTRNPKPDLDYSRMWTEDCRSKVLVDMPRMAAPQPLNTAPSMCHPYVDTSFRWNVDHATAIKQIQDDHALLSYEMLSNEFRGQCEVKCVSPLPSPSHIVRIIRKDEGATLTWESAYSKKLLRNVQTDKLVPARPLIHSIVDQIVDPYLVSTNSRRLTTIDIIPQLIERLKTVTNANIDPRNAILFIQKYQLEKPFIVMDLDLFRLFGRYVYWHQSQYEEILIEVLKQALHRDTNTYSICLHLTITLGSKYEMTYPYFLKLMERVKAIRTEHTIHTQPNPHLVGPLAINAWKEGLEKLISQCDSAVADGYDVELRRSLTHPYWTPPELNLVRDEVARSIVHFAAENLRKIEERVHDKFYENWPQGCIPGKPRKLTSIHNFWKERINKQEYKELRARLKVQERLEQAQYSDGKARNDGLVPLVKQWIAEDERAKQARKDDEAYDRLLSDRRAGVVALERDLVTGEHDADVTDQSDGQAFTNQDMDNSHDDK